MATFFDAWIEANKIDPTIGARPSSFTGTNALILVVENKINELLQQVEK